MKATDLWLYICACHKEQQDCSAIDYMVHNLDDSTRKLLGPETIRDRTKPEPEAQKTMELVCRRLYRILSHCFHHHKEIWEAFEARTSLTARFTRVAVKFSLMPDDLLIIPADALEHDLNEVK